MLSKKAKAKHALQENGLVEGEQRIVSAEVVAAVQRYKNTIGQHRLPSLGEIAEITLLHANTMVGVKVAGKPTLAVPIKVAARMEKVS